MQLWKLRPSSDAFLGLDSHPTRRFAPGGVMAPAFPRWGDCAIIDC